MIRELTEVTLRLQPDPSILATALERTAHSHASVMASCSYHDRFGMVLLLVAEHPDQLEQTLRAAGFAPQHHSVLVVGPQQSPAVGPLVRLQLTRANIGILYSYASWNEQGHGLYVFHTTDNPRARRLLRADPALAELGRDHLWETSAARRLNSNPFPPEQRAA